MEEMYVDSSYIYIGVIIVLSLIVLGLAISLFAVLRKRKMQDRNPYEDSVFRSVDDMGAGREEGKIPAMPASGVPEKARPVPPYTNWDKEGISDVKREASFDGFVQDGDPEKTEEEVSDAAAASESDRPSAQGPSKSLSIDPGTGAGLEPDLALLLFKSHELLLTLTDGMKKLMASKTEEARREKLAEMQDAIKLLDAKGQWAQYRACFEYMYPGFYAEVEAASSEEMSPYELRLAALLSLGVGTKELAELTNRSVRTVETSIYKIRKKLGMGSEEKTSEFLHRFCQAG